MSSINHYIANATGELDDLTGLISQSLAKVIPTVERELNANQIDIIFVAAAAFAIPEYGIGGYSLGPNHVYVYFDPKSKNITGQHLGETLFHEIHHCMRWRDPGYGSTLGEAMVTEGLACLYEQQHSGVAPMYAKVELKKDQIEKAKQLLQSEHYDHSEWFFGSKEIDRWFSYSYGYKLCKEYSAKVDKTASELVNVSAKTVIAAAVNE